MHISSPSKRIRLPMFKKAGSINFKNLGNLKTKEFVGRLVMKISTHEDILSSIFNPLNGAAKAGGIRRGAKQIQLPGLF